MKLARSLSHSLSVSIPLSLALIAINAPAWAAQADQHEAHHPAAAASTPGPKTTSARPDPKNGSANAQMRAMEAMHDRMMAASTPEQRHALMAEHMKVMQDGMSMMKSMAKTGASGMKGLGTMKGDMAAHHQMMEERMDMMQAMMEMMMDRMPNVPVK